VDGDSDVYLFSGRAGAGKKKLKKKIEEEEEVSGEIGNRFELGGDVDSMVADDAALESSAIDSKTADVHSRRANALQFRLTSRDLEILGFLLDQKFASLEQIYFRYFDVRKNVTDALPKGLHVTRQRLQILKRAGLISTERVFSEPRSLYLMTNFGFQVFQSKRPFDAYAKPMSTVDFRNYEHDTKVNDCRVALERSGKVMKWISERRVRTQGFESQFSYSDLPETIVPDGVLVSSKGERIAFEIEASPREKRRFVQKREAYQSVMSGSSPLFHKVIWTAATGPLHTVLKDVIGGNDRFLLNSYDYFLSKLWPKGVPERV
jgi:hypothetical protein